MALLRVFPRRTSYTPTDTLAVVGEPGLWRPQPVDEVHISVAFTWDIPEAVRLAVAWEVYYPGKVRIGGPALGSPVGEFVPRRYVREGVTFTSRGCHRRCPFCLVPEREGNLCLLPITDGHIIADNNWLATPLEHRAATWAMLQRQSRAAVFSGGIDARLVTAETAEEFRGRRIASIYLACDSEACLGSLQRASEHLRFLTRRQKRCYVLVGYGSDTPGEATRRLEACWEAGVLPFAQFYRGLETVDRFDYPREWRTLVRTWSRPAAMFAAHATANAQLRSAWLDLPLGSSAGDWL